MTWKEAHRLAMLAAARLHRRLAIDQSTRIDVFGIIEHIGLLLAFRPFDRTSGAYIFNPEGSSGVVINANEPLARQRYTAAHELGHHVFEHGTTIDEVSSSEHRGRATFRSDREKLAEAFAEWFLMPRPLVQRSLDSMRSSPALSPVAVYSLALRLGTSYDATVRHLGNLEFATRTQVTAWLTTPPKSIKEGLARGVALSDWRRDVWELTGQDKGLALPVHEGDRLVVALEEIPTTGYLWERHDKTQALRSAADGYDESNAIERSNALEGAPWVHWFALDVSSQTQAHRVKLDFQRRRPWLAEEPKERFEVHLDIEQPRLGVREELLALSGS